MRWAALLLVLAACSGESGVFNILEGVRPQFQPGTPNENVQVMTLTAPSDAVRGDTVTITFTVLNADHKGHVLDVQVSLDSVDWFTDGQAVEGCPRLKGQVGDSHCAVVLDIVELDYQADPICQSQNPDASGQLSEWFAAGESRTYTWHWQVAKLSCIPTQWEPVAGEYWLTAYARYVRPNGVVVPGWRRMRFAVR